MTIPAELWADLQAWHAHHPQATWEELEAAVAHRLAAVHAEALTALVAETALPPERPRCPTCDQSMHASGTRTRQVLTRSGEVAPLTRQYFVCSACGTGLFPPG